MNLQEKSETINALLIDLSAEYLVSCLLDEGMSRTDIMIFFDGVLKRKWSADINRAEVEVFENGKEALCLHLNRAGIYDTLPEALFHQFPEPRIASGEDMAKESMKLRLEEKNIRSFFRPFENEIFMQKVYLTLKETREWESLYADFLHGLIPDFWNIDKKIPPRYALRLIRFLPLAFKIAGRYSLTARCLGQILGEEVKMEVQYDENENNGKLKEEYPVRGGFLGKSKLGTDLVVGHTVSGFIGKLVVTIGPLRKTRPEDFFPGGPVDLLLASFYGYFVPVELDVETKIRVPEEHKLVALKPENEPGEAFLGYNTVL